MPDLTPRRGPEDATEHELETNGPFVHLTDRVWVRYDAIILIRQRNTADGQGSEVVVRSMTTGGSPSAYTVWTDSAADNIIDAVVYCSTSGY
jgi:hypothetical protein